MSSDEFTGADLRAALAELGINQKQFAEHWLDDFGGRSIETVNRWATGKRPIPSYIAAYVKGLLVDRRKPDGTV